MGLLLGLLLLALGAVVAHGQIAAPRLRGSELLQATGGRALQQAVTSVFGDDLCFNRPESGVCDLNPYFLFVKELNSSGQALKSIKKVASSFLTCIDAFTQDDCNAYPGGVCAWNGKSCSVKPQVALSVALCPGSKIGEILRCQALTSKSQCTSKTKGHGCAWTKLKGSRTSTCVPKGMKKLSTTQFQAQLTPLQRLTDASTFYDRDLLGCCATISTLVQATACQKSYNVSTPEGAAACDAAPFCKVQAATNFTGMPSPAICTLDDLAFFPAGFSAADRALVQTTGRACQARSAAQCLGSGKLSGLPTRADMVAALTAQEPKSAGSVCPKTFTWPFPAPQYY